MHDDEQAERPRRRRTNDIAIATIDPDTLTLEQWHRLHTAEHTVDDTDPSAASTPDHHAL